MARSAKWVYFFGNGKAEGKGTDRQLLGGKGAGLAEMTNIGLPVPAGFTLCTDCCDLYYKNNRQWPAGLDEQVRANLTRLEKTCGKKLGGHNDPLLVSVRSGAALSMPGMMETILNLGLNDVSVEALARQSSNRRFAMDGYRRLIMMYGSTAKGVERSLFDEAYDAVKNTRTRSRLNIGPEEEVVDTLIDEEELAAIVEQFKRIYAEHAGEPFPQDPYEQLVGAINAVFGSWMADKACTYRRVEKISGLAGTAVNICQMVFGNMGDDCGTGVCFTRDPSTGENTFFGDLLMNAQGEDVVAGVRNPVKLAELQTIMPEAYDQLEAVRAILEVHYREMQDLEFTIERKKLYMLQCRNGKRGPIAAFKIAVDQATKPVMDPAKIKRLTAKKYLPAAYAAKAAKPVITREQAIRRIKPEDIERLFYPIIDPGVDRAELERRRLAEGINAVPGAACGRIVFNSVRAEELASQGQKVLLVCKETSPEDVGGMHVATGILTATGGKTSHAAVVARGWGKCCIVGCQQLRIRGGESMSLNGRDFSEGDILTLDGGTGEVFDGELPLVRPEAPPEYHTFMGWCDEIRRMKVRTNADTPEDAAKAVELGAEGIGLCRTEHMFFDPREPQRIRAIREMILSHDEASRRRALDKLLPFQRRDFEGIFEAMNGKPVTIRLLDPPLHEFLPTRDNAKALQEAADDLNAALREQMQQLAPDDAQSRARLESQLVSAEDVTSRVDQMHETNPMLGHRGCRLTITYPEILDTQVKAIIGAALSCQKRGIAVLPEIMIPLCIDGKELAILIERTHKVAEDEICHALGSEAAAVNALPYMVGTMIETPRAALTADRIAESAEFFSFGTNDLTQTTMALSRDDAGRFLPDYVDVDKAGIFDGDPFERIDVEGVGQLIEMAIAKGRSVKPNLKIGICGEHGGELHSVKFCHRVGMDYVSCSPYRVPIARLAAAQAVLEEQASGKAPKAITKVKATKPKATARKSAVKKSGGKKPAAKKSKKAPARKPAKAGSKKGARR